MIQFLGEGQYDIKLWRNHAAYLQKFLEKKNYAEEAARLAIPARLESAWDNYHQAKSPAYLAELKGTLGLQPLAALKTQNNRLPEPH